MSSKKTYVSEDINKSERLLKASKVQYEKATLVTADGKMPCVVIKDTELIKYCGRVAGSKN